MSQPIVEATTTATFVVRFWREWSAGEPLWRGRIEHVQSGQAVSFRDIEGLLEFLQRFGVGGAAFVGTTSDRLGDAARGR